MKVGSSATLLASQKMNARIVVNAGISHDWQETRERIVGRRDITNGEVVGGGGKGGGIAGIACIIARAIQNGGKENTQASEGGREKGVL
jgi:hypothetical protein